MKTFTKGQTVLFTGTLLDTPYEKYPVEIHYAYDGFYDIKDELGHIYDMMPVTSLEPIPQHTAHLNDVKRICLIRQLELRKKFLSRIYTDNVTSIEKYIGKQKEIEGKLSDIQKQLDTLNKE
jgi:hypothetical protein